MRFFYNIGITLYGLSIRIAALFNPKAKLWIVGRKRIFSKIELKLKNEIRPIIWVHCSSLGEFEQGRPIIEALHHDLKTHALLLTFFSPSGYEIRKEYSQTDYVFYLPLDTPRNAKHFLTIVKPAIAIFVKYEFWLNYLNEISKRTIPAILMSAKFRSNQLFFKWYGKFYKKAIFTFEHIFVQNKESLKLLNEIGCSSVTIAGDTRFDRVVEIAEKAEQFPLIEQFIKGKFTIIAGSTWEKDEEIISDFFSQHSDENLRLILAPHEIHQRHLEQIEKRFQEPILFFTEITEKISLENSRIIIIDTIGMLSSIYQYGKIAYVGGGFGKGIHNILEAAAFGLPVVFGPNYHKFSEAVDLIELHGAFTINNGEDFKEMLNKLLDDSELLKSASQISKEFVKANCGAKKRILYHIFNNQKKVLTKFS